MGGGSGPSGVCCASAGPPRLRAILAYLDRQLADTETLSTYLRLQAAAVRQALAAVESQAPGARRLAQAEQQPALEAPARGRRVATWWRSPCPPNHPLGAGVHVADCTVIQRDTRPISADEARTALGDGKFFRACEFCGPDSNLGFLD
ncbi:DUF6233 domain-containing protein [Streptomyces sp. NPDC051133]|uniref:DUF6233 domain-containing protein n=1 Tax=Streptomyces sp. NPDC051133 TaxID=3155521 RepID=UPI00341D07A6